MRVIFTKHQIFKLFSLKIFSFITEYSERSSEKDDDFNDEMIALKTRMIKRKGQ